MVIAAIVVIVIVVAGVAGAYVLMSQPASNSPSSNPTSSPAPTATATAPPSTTQTPSATKSPATSETPEAPTSSPAETTAPTASPASAPNVAGATSMKYSVSLTQGGVFQGSYTFQGKNADTANFMMRIDYTDKSGDQETYIVNGAEQKAWAYSGGEWEDLSIAYSAQYSTWNNLWQGYMNSLLAWSGSGDYSYTQGDATVKIYDISVNPVLADSLFQHS